MAPTRDSDEVKKRIGLPLGLIVALIKDGNGNIHVNVPITGTLTDRQFDFSDAIWTAVRNVIVNILKAPFRAIGGLFTSGDDKIEEIKVDPVVFAAGSAVLSPELERQTVRVADFLRRAPYVGLTLSSVTSPADVEALKERAVAARAREVPAGAGDRGPARPRSAATTRWSSRTPSSRCRWRSSSCCCASASRCRPARSPSCASAGST